ncbi:ornithine carbamoyltransferase [Helicobacter trogontum]|uniref:Ornithine carbamoyltransferase n=1 Tax=Helicobacter trogontum TaxID=50960 RepID=A0A4V6I3F2_9HELI|nr:ornithine carbamoyltransferase [Helicobacter trogontum]MCI5787128.1 ornithine carbamoyltransferase [Helicobacter trogontum]MDY5184473.1 ornithine carbamoyltransferase [Helicobacter trogontum]TLD99712.1 ornithine carbamoyltransferase [Helicobacter trogontum]
MRHFLTINDFTKHEILEMLALAIKIKTEHKNGVETPYLKGKTLAMIFEKSSTRTRVSFQVGIYQLGGFGISLSNNELQLGRGEIVRDSSAVISSMVDMIMVRTHMHERLEEFARFSSVPVINGLSDVFHPMQLLADYLTMIECGIFVPDPLLHNVGMKENIAKPIVAYIGDGNNMANSWLMLASKLGFEIRLACPNKYMPHKDIIKIANENAKISGATIVITDDIFSVAKGAHVITTDTWVSMGQEDEKEKRMWDFKDYKVDSNIMSLAHKDTIFLHCLPAYRGLEVSEEVIDGEQSKIIEEAHNRLHAQKGVMVWLNEQNQTKKS